MFQGRFKSTLIHGELLVRLKDLPGLNYREIARFSEFRDIGLQSLGKLYNAKKRMIEKD